MTSMDLDVSKLDWLAIGAQLDADGYAVLRGLFEPEAVREVVRLIDERASLRRERLESSDLGRGELSYLDSMNNTCDTPCQTPWDTWRNALYRELVPIANRWNGRLGMAAQYPAHLDAFTDCMNRAGQTRSLSYVSRLQQDDFMALHQRNDDEHVFPLQLVALVTEPDVDFRGGGFVMTEQRPRMQSRPMVVPLQLGDMAVIATAHRPVKGTRGDYRVNLKHAISRVHSGTRIGVELSFHTTR